MTVAAVKWALHGSGPRGVVVTVILRHRWTVHLVRGAAS